MDGNGSNSNGPTGMGWAAASARRKAIRQTMQPIRIKHGIEHAPTINHPRSGLTGPKFGTGGGFKAGGF